MHSLAASRRKFNGHTQQFQPARVPALRARRDKIVAMLKADHKKVKKAFKDFEKVDPQERSESCQALVAATLAEIEVHAEIEEQMFYPAARGAIEDRDLVDEAEVRAHDRQGAASSS
jgi:hypothetical protein